MTKSRFALVALILFACSSLRAETVQCPCSKDTWISTVGKEADTNMGKAPQIKLKGYQEYGLLDFDVSALKGKKITAAELHVFPITPAQFSKDRGTDFRWFTVTTVSSPWEEGSGTDYSTDSDGHGATFNEASFEKRTWAGPGSKNWDVTQGNGETLRFDVDGGDPSRDGWITIPLDKRIVQAILAKSSHGLMLMDGSLFINGNEFISSREGKSPPFLNVTVEDNPLPAPKTPSIVTLKPAPNEAGVETGAVEVFVSVPENTFSFDIKIDNKPASRWQLPFAEATGKTQSFVLNNLPPEKEFKFDIAAVDASGRSSGFTTITGKASGKLVVPKLPASSWQPAGGTPPIMARTLKVWALPEICKIDPLTGNLVQEPVKGDVRSKNSVWDAGTQTIHLSAARDEIVGFQIVFELAEGDGASVSCQVEDLPGISSKVWRTWFVNVKDQWQADYAIPTKPGEALVIPAPDNKIPKQRAAVAALDLIVPLNAKPGRHSGSVTIRAGKLGNFKLLLDLDVYDTVIPPEMSFVPELNCYGGPGTAGTEFFLDSFRLAHYHRNTINRVPYSQSAKPHADWYPKVGPDGHVTDWTVVDTHLGPLLDGSAFKDNPRAGVPVPLLYLPFNESWPLPMLEHYHPGEKVPLEGENWKILHDIYAKPPDAAFDQEYKDAFVNCVKDYVKHFEDKGWTHTLAEGFFNNKYGFGHHDKLENGQPVMKDGKKEQIPALVGTGWTMDEPSTWLDWQALKFYSTLFHQGIRGQKNTKFVFRGDISRPMWQGNCMDGSMEMMVAGGEQFSMLPLMEGMRHRSNMKTFAYGSCNSQDKANHNSTAWVLKTYAYGSDGVVPWQSLGGDEAFDKGDFTGPDNSAPNGNLLIVDGTKRFGVNAIASFRVHAFRSGAQLVELLRLLEQKRGWTRTQSAALVSQLIPLGTQFKQAFADDAAALKFDELSGDSFVVLKEGLLKMLTE